MGPRRAVSIHFRVAQVVSFTRIRYHILSDMFSLKKKELFNVKEAHNHSFSHAVCRPFLLFTVTLVNGAQTANWGWYYKSIILLTAKNDMIIGLSLHAGTQYTIQGAS